MSLDIIIGRIVPPSRANKAHAVERLGALTEFWALRRSGYVCVSERRIGRNCLDDAWHHQYQLLSPGEYDDPALESVRDGALTAWARLRFATTRAEFDERIAPHLIREPGDGVWFEGDALDEPWDFVRVSW